MDQLARAERAAGRGGRGADAGWRLRSLLISLALHAAVIALMAWVAVDNGVLGDVVDDDAAVTWAVRLQPPPVEPTPAPMERGWTDAPVEPERAPAGGQQVELPEPELVTSELPELETATSDELTAAAPTRTAAEAIALAFGKDWGRPARARSSSGGAAGALAGPSVGGGGTSGGSGGGGTGSGAGGGGDGTGAGSSVVAVREPVFVAPVLLTSPEPQYPPLSSRLGETGTTLLGIHVNADGTVGQVDVQKSSGSKRLDAAAVAGVKSWTFKPATRDGVAVAALYQHRVTFRLDGSPR